MLGQENRFFLYTLRTEKYPYEVRRNALNLPISPEPVGPKVVVVTMCHAEPLWAVQS